MDLLTIEAFRDYVETHSAEIFEQAFMAFNSANYLTHLPGNKGEEIGLLGETNVDDMVQRWKELDVAGGRQSVDLKPSPVRTYRGQLDERYVPEKLEKTYLGYMRQTGQNPEDFPFEAYVAMQLIKGIAQFHEKGLWQAKKDDASQSGMALYDGFLEQIKTAVTETDITPLSFGQPYKPRSKDESIPTGFTSILDIVEEMYNAFDDEIKAQGVNFYMSHSLKTMYNQAYRNVHGTHPTTAKMYNINRTIVDGTDENPASLLGIGGLQGSQRIVATPVQNAVYSYDAATDMSWLNYQYILNVLRIWGAFRFGSKFLRTDDTWMKVNELT